MLDSNLLIGLAGVVVAALIYFAGVQRGKQQRRQDQDLRTAERTEDLNREIEAARSHRIQKVVEAYRTLVNAAQSSNLNGMLSAGALELESSSEVAEVCRQIKKLGLTPGLPQTYMEDLEGADLLLFFRLLQERPDQARTNSGVRMIIREVTDKGSA